MHGRNVTIIFLQKEDKHRVRLTVGGNIIDYPGNVSTPTVDLITAKILFNSVVSTPNSRFMCTDDKDLSFNTPMECYEYTRLPIAIITQEIIDQYDIMKRFHNVHAYTDIRKGMYGLTQSGCITNKSLTNHLAKYGYNSTCLTPGLWEHGTHPITFSLVTDKFGVKYVGRWHAQHLVSTPEDLYRV